MGLGNTGRFLNLMLLVPIVGITLRLAALGPTHPYLLSMYGLVIVALIARRISSAIIAVNVYCWLAPLSIFLMVHAEAKLHPDYSWGAVGLVPLLGILAVAILGRDLPSLLSYALWAMGQLAIMGHFYGSTGWTGVLIFLVGGLSLLLSLWLMDNPVAELQKANEKLDKLRGEASRLNQKLEQEILHDL